MGVRCTHSAVIICVCVRVSMPGKSDHPDPIIPCPAGGPVGRSVALVQRLNILRSWFRDAVNCTRSTELNKKCKFFSEDPYCVSPWWPWTTLCRETHCCMQLREQTSRISGLPLHNTQFWQWVSITPPSLQFFPPLVFSIGTGWFVRFCLLGLRDGIS